MGALHINGQKTTGLDITLAEGVFIDADNLIFSYAINSGSISQTEYSYTATEDCYVRFMICTPSENQITKILIDDTEIFRIQNTSPDKIFSNSCLLKKGQVITYSNIGPYTNIGVYGIQQGSSISSEDNSISGVYIHKIDKNATMIIDWSNVDLSSDGMTLDGNIPSAFRPKTNIKFITKTYNGSAYVDAVVLIGADGLIRIRNLDGTVISGLQIGFTQTNFVSYITS